MAQITNSTGDIKVMNDKGNIKWFCKKIVEDKQLMKTMKYEVVNAPDSFPPTEHILDVKNYVDPEYIPGVTETDTNFEDYKNSKVKEAEKKIDEQVKRTYNRKK